MSSEKKETPPEQSEIKDKTFMGIDGRRHYDRRTLPDRRRPWANRNYKGVERRYHQRRRTKYIAKDDKIVERYYDRRRDR
jgi:hypothetical protein